MAETLDAVATWVQATALSQLFQSQVEWLWPLCESLHFLALCILIGAAGFFDLRLLGFIRGVRLATAHRFIPWAKGAFAVSLATGLVFLISQPYQYATNLSMWLKALFLVLAGGNALVYELVYSRQLQGLPPDAAPPLAARVIGGLSLVSWFAVLYFGRMIPYLVPDPTSGV